MHLKLAISIGLACGIAIATVVLSNGLGQINPNTNVDRPATKFAEPDFPKCADLPEQFVCTEPYLACRASGLDYFACYDKFHLLYLIEKDKGLPK